jgi:HEPN domain-containing protein
VTLFEEWVDKAEGDYETAAILNRPRKQPQYDAVCYHCQQSAEKYLKAYLIWQSAIPRHTHNLQGLLVDCVSYDTTLLVLQSLVRFLDPFSVQFRYPGDAATQVLAKDALSTLRSLRRILRRKMGL